MRWFLWHHSQIISSIEFNSQTNGKSNLNDAQPEWYTNWYVCKKSMCLFCPSKRQTQNFPTLSGHSQMPRVCLRERGGGMQIKSKTDHHPLLPQDIWHWFCSTWASIWWGKDASQDGQLTTDYFWVNGQKLQDFAIHRSLRAARTDCRENVIV